MSHAVSNSRSVCNNDFGNNATLHLGDVHHHVSDQANQCLKDLRSTDPRHDKTRIQNTKGGLLKDSYRWILENGNFKDWRNNAQNRILWIKGNPGKGKTMLLCGIIDELMPMTKLAQPIDQNTNTILLSYFFCQGTDARINNATAVLRGLIYLLIVQEPLLISHVQTRYKHAGKDLFSDVNAWVALSEIFVAILQDSKVKEIILIIDALDECERDLPKLLDAVAQQFSFPHVKCIISSRNIPSIQQRLESHIPQGILSLELKENASCVSQAVDAYINHRVSGLRSIQNNNGLQDQLRKLIQQKANGTFLWVSLVMKDLEEVQEWEVMEVVADMPMDLAALYKRMINQIYSLPGRNKRLCKSLLSAILTAYYPLGLAEIGVLAGMPDKISENLESIRKLVLMCGSFLTLSEDHVYFIHQSAKDFLSTETYSMDVAQRHLDVFKRSVTAISKLSKNIYCLTDFGPRPKDAQAPTPNPLASLKYSCFYWAYHLCDTCSASPPYEAQLILNGTLEPFLKNHLLRWIESLSLLDGLLEGLRSIRKLLHELPHNENTQLSGFLSTIEKFMLRNGPLIAESPLQVYSSALIFSPMHDHIRATQWNERLLFVKDIQGIRTDAFLQKLEGHNDTVTALAFSPNGETLASKSEDNTLRCWDVATGVLKRTIQCYDDGASAIAFSPDNRMLLLAAYGNPMLGGDTERSKKGKAKSDNYWITCIPVSPDSGTPEAVRANRLVQLNGPSRVNEDYDDVITASTFSPDCKTLASGLKSGSIQLWDTATGTCRQTIKGHDSKIEAISISPDGRMIASGCMRKLRLSNIATGAPPKELHWLYVLPRAIAFCQDSKKLLLGIVMGRTKLYDPAMGTLVPTSTGLINSVIAISPDNKILASAGVKIQLWDATMATQEKYESDRLADASRIIALSLDGRTVACATSNTVQIWDTATGECWRTIKDYWPEIFSQTEITSWPGATTRQESQEDCRLYYTAVAFSANGRILALGSRRYTKLLPSEPPCQIQVWDIVAGECTYRRSPLDKHAVSAIAFSSNGNRLAVGFMCETIMLLDIETGECLWETKRHDVFGPQSLAFFPDSSMLASAHYVRFGAKTCEIDLWDTATGSHRQTCVVDTPDETCSSIMFSPDGRYLYIEHQQKVRLFLEDEKILSPDTDLSRALPDQGIPVTDGWITKDGRRLLWIPPEYRTRCAFVCGNTVVLGHGSGISFIWLNLWVLLARALEKEITWPFVTRLAIIF